MSTHRPPRPRGASAYPLSSWAEYLRIHCALLAVSETADVPALARVYQACTEVGMSTEQADDVVLSAFGYHTDQIAEAFRCLRMSELRFALLADCYQMARGDRVTAPVGEPTLRALAAHLEISDSQQRAIERYIRACDPLVDHPWGDVLTEVNAALQLVGDSGASILAVTETRGVSLRAGVSYAALIMLVREAVIS